MQLRGAYLSMHRQANAQFAQFGVTADQFVLLTALAEEDAVTQQDLVRRCHSDPNTVRAMLVRLEKLGLVARGPHATDGRARSVVLTDPGRDTQRRLSECNEDFQGRLISQFTADERAALLDYLARITRANTRPDRPKTRSRSAGR